MYSKDDFGKDLIKEVRDRTIRQYHKKTSGLMKSEDDQALFRRYESLDESAKEFIKDLIPMIVDTSLHNTLCMIEDSDNFILTVGEDDIRNVSDGLAGELYTEDGWIAKYSSER
jgi:hypothetical protein